MNGEAEASLRGHRVWDAPEHEWMRVRRGVEDNGTSLFLYLSDLNFGKWQGPGVSPEHAAAQFETVGGDETTRVAFLVTILTSSPDQRVAPII